jgi:hypothetical protein
MLWNEPVKRNVILIGFTKLQVLPYTGLRVLCDPQGAHPRPQARTECTMRLGFSLATAQRQNEKPRPSCRPWPGLASMLR